jgi:hypothetical protein
MARARTAMVVGDDGAERRRIIALLPEDWCVVDGGRPGAALDAMTDAACGAMIFTAATDSIDLATWYQALMLSGYGGVVIDSRPSGALPTGVLRAVGPVALAEALNA